MASRANSVSLAGLAVNTLYSFVLSDGGEVMGTVGVSMTALIWVVAIALLAYSVRQRSRGVLR